MFLENDKVVYINDSIIDVNNGYVLFQDDIEGLVLNNIYTVNFIINEVGAISIKEIDEISGTNIRMFSSHRFKLLSEIRKEKIKKLTNE